MRILSSLLLLLLLPAFGQAKDEFLKPDEAYPVSAQAQGNSLLVHWDIAEGYYLYRSKFRFKALTPGVMLGDPELPPGQSKQDPFFGEIEIYRHSVDIRVPLRTEGQRPDILELEVHSQGCAEAGICYPPHRQKLMVALNTPTDEPPPVPREALELAKENLTPTTGSQITIPGSTAKVISEAKSPATPSSSAPMATSNPSASLKPTSPIQQAQSPTTEANSKPKDALEALGALGDALGLDDEDEFLKPEQAYQLTAEVVDGTTLRLHWRIAKDTYLYSDKIAFQLDGSGVMLGNYQFPTPKIKKNSVRLDGTLGDVAVFEDELEMIVPLERTTSEPSTIELTVKYQGCDGARGICYPPQKKTFTLELPALPQTSIDTPTAFAEPASRPSPSLQPGNAPTFNEQSEQDKAASLLRDKSLWLALLTFFGIGVLLAFTPCVFPMIPILSGIIAGQGRNITTRHAFTLSLVYVLAMAVTYAVVGVLAGLFGASFNLSAAFQNPWILTGFALVFVALALSMFGFYDLQLPASWQGKLSEISNRQKGGELGGVAIMGLLSALIVGPCVAPPLAGILIYIAQTGDGLFGGLALFAMALGMGAPLIVIGTSAGKLLPKAGAWMDAVKAVFGVIMLALAITMLERFLPEIYTMTLWGILLIVSAVYMGALQPLPEGASGWHKLWKGLGVVLLIYGSLFLVGVAANGKDNLQPLRGVFSTPGITGTPQQPQHVTFKRIKNRADLERELAAAKAKGQPVMLDFYADWCVYCKKMEKNVFPDPRVQAALADFLLLQADVTEQDEQDLALQESLGITAPPAMLFWNAQGQELRHLRLMGYMDAEEFSAHVQKVHR